MGRTIKNECKLVINYFLLQVDNVSKANSKTVQENQPAEVFYPVEKCQHYLRQNRETIKSLSRPKRRQNRHTHVYTHVTSTHHNAPMYMQQLTALTACQ